MNVHDKKIYFAHLLCKLGILDEQQKEKLIKQSQLKR